MGNGIAWAATHNKLTPLTKMPQQAYSPVFPMDTQIEDFRALQYDTNKNQFRFCRLKCETLKDEEVMVRVAYAGLCPTDFLIINSELPCRLRPIVLGHEISGTVQKMGYLVKNVALGDRVAINPRSDQFCCERCKPGCVCVGKKISLGMYMDGGFAEYCIVPSYMIHEVPKHTTLKEAVLCSTLCDILHSWRQAAPVELTENILVMGAGVQGLLMTAILHSEGYRKVTITEPSSERRAIIKNLAPEFRAISPLQLLKLKNNAIWKPDLVFDCSGNPVAIMDALSCLERGGRLVLNRCSLENQKIQISPFQIISKEIKIIGSLTDHESFPIVLEVLDIIGEKYIDFEQWGIKLYELDDYEQAFLDLEEGNVTKVVFQVDKDLVEDRFEHPESETIAEKIKADLLQLIEPRIELSRKVSAPKETYDPTKTVRDTFASSILNSLLRRESLLLDIKVPENVRPIAEKSFNFIRSTLEEAKRRRNIHKP